MATTPVTSPEMTMVGKVGRVTGTVAKGTVGEVMLPVAGGVEAFYAYPADESESIEPGTRVVVMDYEPPRTVTVTVLS
jgi:hypothetical protein